MCDPRLFPVVAGPTLVALSPDVFRTHDQDARRHAMRAVIGLSLMFIAGMAQAQASNCASVAAPKAMPIRPTVVAPIASEMVLPSHQLGAPTGVLSQAFDETLAVDQVLLRQRIDACKNVAT